MVPLPIIMQLSSVRVCVCVCVHVCVCVCMHACVCCVCVVCVCVCGGGGVMRAHLGTPTLYTFNWAIKSLHGCPPLSEAYHVSVNIIGVYMYLLNCSPRTQKGPKGT